MRIKHKKAHFTGKHFTKWPGKLILAVRSLVFILKRIKRQNVKHYSFNDEVPPVSVNFIYQLEMLKHM